MTPKASDTKIWHQRSKKHPKLEKINWDLFCFGIRCWCHTYAHIVNGSKMKTLDEKYYHFNTQADKVKIIKVDSVVSEQITNS